VLNPADGSQGARTLPAVPERRLVGGAHKVDRPLALRVRQVAERRLCDFGLFVCLFVCSFVRSAGMRASVAAPWCTIAPTVRVFLSAVRR
jgi:hypothetical protein